MEHGITTTLGGVIMVGVNTIAVANGIPVELSTGINYSECEECERMIHNDLLENNVCFACRNKKRR